MVRQIAGLTLLIILFGCGEQPEGNSTHEINSAVDLAMEYDESVVLAVGDKTFDANILAPVLSRLNGDSVLVHLKIESLINRSLIMQDAYERGFASTSAMERGSPSKLSSHF